MAISTWRSAASSSSPYRAATHRPMTSSPTRARSISRRCRSCKLLALDLELARHCAPDFHLAGQEGAQLLRALQRERDLLALGELRGDARLADDRGQLGAEAGHHRGRSAGWREHAPPRIGLEVGKA